ncbi:response regulator [Skermanella stibiiresistens]|uniref:response regulator n=1 Tax=Skermanella stibiiresistens TaxID=913326 RepID=UPI002480D0B6|nr:response regulator [Skermanella stibiiresistens]
MRDLSQGLNILLVEDNPADARLVAEVMKEGRFHAVLHHVEDGVEAMAFLRQEPPFENKPRPDLLLLDLNMPRKDGWEVLEEIRADDALATLPVIILTTSDVHSDVRRAYSRHANCFLTKPVELDEFIKMITLLKDFWLTAVRLPGA